MSDLNFHTEHAEALRSRISGLPQRQSTFGSGGWHHELFDTLEYVRTALNLAVCGERLLLYMHMARDGDHVLVGELGSGGMINYYRVYCYSLPYAWIGPAGRHLLAAHLANVRSAAPNAPDWLCSSRGIWPSQSWRTILFTEPTFCDGHTEQRSAVATEGEQRREVV